jgi:hypothetical protein
MFPDGTAIGGVWDENQPAGILVFEIYEVFLWLSIPVQRRFSISIETLTACSFVN